jgi:DNA-3-methyladenine glycosylase I
MRCPWPGDDALMIKYHDTEWGVPVHDDKKIFEFLVLESAQAGLSWRTILHKREGYRRLFVKFDYKKISKFGKREVNKLLKDPSIIRNRLKIEATINNAKRFIEVQKEFGTFSKYMWGFVNNKVIDGKIRNIKDIPAITKEAEIFAKDLKKRGFKFLGPTVVYAHMQAVGMVNDHLVSCFCHKKLSVPQKYQ